MVPTDQDERQVPFRPEPGMRLEAPEADPRVDGRCGSQGSPRASAGQQPSGARIAVDFRRSQCVSRRALVRTPRDPHPGRTESVRRFHQRARVRRSVTAILRCPLVVRLLGGTEHDPIVIVHWRKIRVAGGLPSVPSSIEGLERPAALPKARSNARASRSRPIFAGSASSLEARRKATFSSFLSLPGTPREEWRKRNSARSAVLSSSECTSSSAASAIGSFSCSVASQSP